MRFLVPKVSYIFLVVVPACGVGAVLAPPTVPIYHSKYVSEGIKRKPIDSKFHIL
jgi:hypothetical protein